MDHLERWLLQQQALARADEIDSPTPVLPHHRLVVLFRIVAEQREVESPLARRRTMAPTGETACLDQLGLHLRHEVGNLFGLLDKPAPGLRKRALVRRPDSTLHPVPGPVIGKFLTRGHMTAHQLGRLRDDPGGVDQARLHQRDVGNHPPILGDDGGDCHLPVEPVGPRTLHAVDRHGRRHLQGQRLLDLVHAPLAGHPVRRQVDKQCPQASRASLGRVTITRPQDPVHVAVDVVREDEQNRSVAVLCDEVVHASGMRPVDGKSFEAWKRFSRLRPGVDGSLGQSGTCKKAGKGQEPSYSQGTHRRTLFS